MRAQVVGLPRERRVRWTVVRACCLLGGKGLGEKRRVEENEKGIWLIEHWGKVVTAESDFEASGAIFVDFAGS